MATQTEPKTGSSSSSRAEGRSCTYCGAELSAERLYVCADCDNHVADQLAQIAVRRKRERITRLLSQSGLPLVYRLGERPWNALSRALGEKARVVDHLASGKGLYLYGPAGAYKTSLAAAQLTEAILGGVEGRYVYLPDLFTELSAIYSADDSRSRADVIERYATTPCLVLDDFDKIKPSRHSAEVLLAILDYRYRERKSWLIVTANRSADDLLAEVTQGAGESYSEPIMRRISELCVVIPMEAA